MSGEGPPRLAREFIPARGGKLPPPARWWSLTLWAQQRRAGITDPPPLRTAVREDSAR
jgi:hypothetical protein